MTKELTETRPAEQATPARRHIMREFDRFFDRMSSAIELPAMERLLERAIGPSAFAPVIDVTESDDAYKLTAELPGLEPSEVDVSVISERLVIKGEKKRESEKSVGGEHVSERTFGAFSRSFQLPDDVDTSGIEATHHNGVLSVRLPKSPDAIRPQKIEIQTHA